MMAYRKGVNIFNGSKVSSTDLEESLDQCLGFGRAASRAMGLVAFGYLKWYVVTRIMAA